MEPKGIATLERALTVLAAFTPAEPTLSLAEISRRTGLYKSTLLRLLATLQHFDYIGQQEDGSYHVGVGAFYLGSLYQSWVQPADLIRPVLQRLVEQTGESASFNVREGAVRVCVYRVDSPHKIRDHVRIGDVLPLAAGAAGKILCAYSDDPPAGDWDAVRAGFLAVTRGEIESETAGVSSPVFGVGGKCEGALAITGPAYRFDDDAVNTMQLALLRASAELSLKLGGRSAELEAALRRMETAHA